ncbi:MAG: hypothetical protein ACFFCD_04385 [Promethearchaeota archaeon]
MQSVAKKNSIKREFSPLRKEDRIEALLSAHTSVECPFYVYNSPTERSKCLLDPLTWRIWDCRGVCFFQGLCCEYILDAVENNFIGCTGEVEDFSGNF